MINSRYPLTSEYQRTRRVVRSKNTTKTAILGDETQNIYSERLGYYFARQVMSADVNGNALLGPTFYLRANPAAGILPQAGRKVLYKKSDRGVWTITGSDLDDLEQIGINAIEIEPNDPARRFVLLWQIVNLNSYTVGGLEVNVHSWQYHTADNIVHFFKGTNAATQVDLAAHVPGTADTHRYALLVFNITEHLLGNPPLQVYAGTAVSIFPPTKNLTINTDLQTCYDLLPADELIVPIKAYYLEYGQTKDAGISKNVDVRQFINVPSLSTGSAPADAKYLIQVADGDLPNAQVMGALGTGLTKNTTGTGVQSIAVPNTDYLPPSAPVMDSATINTALSGSAISNDATFGGANSTTVPTTAAVKGYVDQTVLGLNAKADVRLATAAPLPTNTYANGSSGVGATLTGSATGVLTIDGVAVALNDRILVKDEASGLKNGIYKCTTAGAIGVAYVLTRTPDGDTDAELRGGWMISIEGTANATQAWVNTNVSAITFGSTSVTFGQFSAGVIVAGDGLDRTGNTIDVDSTVVRTTGPQTITGKTIDGDDNTLQDVPLSAIKTVGANIKRFITRDASGVISDATNPPLDNLQHTHQNAAGGGQLTDAALSAAVGIAKGGTGQTTQTAAFDALAPTTTQGDIIYYNGTDNVRLAKGTATQHLGMNSGATAPEWKAGVTIDKQYFNTPATFPTWTKPAGCYLVHVICVGGGGGGGSGRRDAAAVNRFGGGGGAGGFVTDKWFDASELGATEQCDPGAGGAGGAAVPTNATNGNNGTGGGPTVFGGDTTITGGAKLHAEGGGGGLGGILGPTAGGTGCVTLGTTFQYYGSSGGNGGAVAAGVTALLGAWGPTGGGGGGGIDTGNTARNGGNGGPPYGIAFEVGNGGGSNGAAGGTANGGAASLGTNGSNGTTNGTSINMFGSGGGGGAPNTNVGRAGGTGGGPGGGGGGGSSSLNGNASGAGGNGANGGVFVISYCYT